MNDDTNKEPETEAEAEAKLDAQLEELERLSNETEPLNDDISKPKGKSGPGWFKAGAFIIMAAGLGGAAGYGLSIVQDRGWLGGDAATPSSAELEQLQSALTSARQDRDALKAQVDRLSGDIASLERQLNNIDIPDYDPPEPVDLTPVENRLSALEAIATEDLDASGVDFAGIQSRLTKLEQAAPDEQVSENFSAELADLEARLDDLQSQLDARSAIITDDADAKPIIGFAQPDNIRELQRSFPHDELRLAAQMYVPDDASWWAKTRAKHLPDVPEPDFENAQTRLVKQAQSALEAGNVTEAVAFMDKLPDSVRQKADRWMTLARRDAGIDTP